MKLKVIIPNSGMDRKTLDERERMLAQYADPDTEISVDCIAGGLPASNRRTTRCRPVHMSWKKWQPRKKRARTRSSYTAEAIPPWRRPGRSRTFRLLGRGSSRGLWP